MTYDELLLAAVAGRYPTSADIDQLPTPPDLSRTRFVAGLVSALGRIFASGTRDMALAHASRATARHRAAWGSSGPPRPSEHEDQEP